MELKDEIIAQFVNDGCDLHSHEFLAGFPYMFLDSKSQDRRTRVLEAAYVPPYESAVEATIKAAFSDSHGLSTKGYLCAAVEDFLNYVIPRIAGLPDADESFDTAYTKFDNSMFGDACLVTVFAILSNVWDNGGVVILPPEYDLRYVSSGIQAKADSRWWRERFVPYAEISKSASPIGMGRRISDEGSYFVLSRSLLLPKDDHLIATTYRLRDETTKEFLLSVRILNGSAAFSDYRGFRTIGHLSTYHMNLMNFPDESLIGGVSRELTEHDGVRLRSLLPALSSQTFNAISTLDIKIEEALRRPRESMLDRKATETKVALDQLLDYFQVYETLLPIKGRPMFATRGAALVSGGILDRHFNGNRTFLERMYDIRNDALHGRVGTILTTNPHSFSPSDVDHFRHIVHTIATLYIMNGNLDRSAKRLATGKTVSLKTAYSGLPEDLKALRKARDLAIAW